MNNLQKCLNSIIICFSIIIPYPIQAFSFDKTWKKNKSCLNKPYKKVKENAASIIAVLGFITSWASYRHAESLDAKLQGLSRLYINDYEALVLHLKYLCRKYNSGPMSGLLEASINWREVYQNSCNSPEQASKLINLYDNKNRYELLFVMTAGISLIATCVVVLPILVKKLDEVTKEYDKEEKEKIKKINAKRRSQPLTRW